MIRKRFKHCSSLPKDIVGLQDFIINVYRNSTSKDFCGIHPNNRMDISVMN